LRFSVASSTLKPSLSQETAVTDYRRMLDEVYEIMAASEAYSAYAERHNIRSAPILTVVEDEMAELVCERLAPRIVGKTVVEIGGGTGMLSLAMATVAKRVFCIEANPTWAAAWTQIVLERKPRNMSYLFGAADEFVGSIRGDVAVVCTHSNVQNMKLIAQQFAPEAIDVYGEIIADNPAAFDRVASRLRAAS
jgi:precorrin-6B methylase 2